MLRLCEALRVAISKTMAGLVLPAQTWSVTICCKFLREKILHPIQYPFDKGFNVSMRCFGVSIEGVVGPVL